MDEKFPKNLKWNFMVRSFAGAQAKNINKYNINFGYTEFESDVSFGFTVNHSHLGSLIKRCFVTSLPRIFDEKEKSITRVMGQNP